MITHPVATLWFKFRCKMEPKLLELAKIAKEKKKSQAPFVKALQLLEGPVRADFPGWKSFKRHAAS